MITEANVFGIIQILTLPLTYIKPIPKALMEHDSTSKLKQQKNRRLKPLLPSLIVLSYVSATKNKFKY